MVYMENFEEEELKLRAKSLSVKEGLSRGVMDGFGIRYITPYALALGMNNTVIGLLNSLPSLLGNFSQIKGSKLIEKVPRKKLVMTGASLQALMWIPLILIGLLFFYFGLNKIAVSISILIFYTLLIFFSSFVNPAWNSWTKDIVSDKLGEFYSKRTALLHLSVLVSMFLAGFILDYFNQTKVFFGFMIIFGLAFIGRSISVFLFSKSYEPQMKPKDGYYFNLVQFLKKSYSNNFGRFVIFTTVLSFATAVASPFFAVYMLKDLSFSYYQFTLISVSSVLSTILFLPFWGRFSDKYGNLEIMKIASFFVIFVPILWLFSPIIMGHSVSLLIAFLFFVEFFSGFWWGGLNLSINNFVYDAVSKDRMAICTTYNNLTSALGVFVGTLLGGILSSYSIIIGMQAMLFVFLLSGILRLLAYVIFVPKLKEVRGVSKFKVKEMIKGEIRNYRPF